MLGLFKRDPFIRFLPLVLWCAVIFTFSAIPGSGKDIEPPLWYVLERKSAHVFEYAVLSMLAYRFLIALYPREAFSRIAVLVAAFGLSYGALDEFHQSFVFGRGARLSDVAIDGLGVLLALTFIFVLYVGRKR